jgi:signal peptidase I
VATDSGSQAQAPEENSGEQRGEKAPRSGFAGVIREFAIIIVGALIATTLLRMFLLQVFVIPSGSMEQTLLPQDRVLVQKVIPYRRGDVVVFTDDNEWMGYASQEALPPAEDAQGRVSVNGRALDEGSYLYRDEDGKPIQPSEYTFDVVVPADRVFLLGDHRNDSADSRCHLKEEADGVQGAPAFVRTSSVVGTAAAIVLPFDRIRGLSRPATFENVPAATGAAPAQPIVRGDAPAC